VILLVVLRLKGSEASNARCFITSCKTRRDLVYLLLLLAWLAKNPATFGQHFPAIRWDSARSQGTVLLSVVYWSPPTWWL